MITMQDLYEHNEFHYDGPDHCQVTVGPRGGVHISKQEIWRVNGEVKRWKRSPERVRVPVKYGMYGYAYITEREFDQLHTVKDCPVTKFYEEQRLKRQPAEKGHPKELLAIFHEVSAAKK